jgi:hypothetical protein
MIVGTAVDTWADEDRPSANFGDNAKLWVNGGAGSDTRYAYVFFARPFPLGVTVTAATLRLHLAEDWNGSQTLTAKRIDEAWKEGRLKWSNRPGIDATNDADVNVASLDQGDEVELDLTAMMGDVSAGGAWFGVRLELDTDNDRALASSDHPRAEWRPTLELEWSAAPSPPTNLAPSGGRAVSKTKPLLTWTFSDLAGSTVQASSQVQVSTTSDFSSPAYDSGKVANTVPQWDLGLTAFAALADGATRFWRVKVWDGTDLESEWSDVQEFAREAKGTLTITNPDEAPDNYVEETTPPIAWTFSDTQEAFAVTLWRVEAGGTLTTLANVSRTASDEVEWEVPAGILRTGDTYRVGVAVWDDVDRQHMTGDTDYVYASRDFTYTRAGTPSPTTDLTADPNGASVILTWERTTDPDFFSLVVDGVEVLDRIEVEAVFVTGDTYSLRYWGALPRVEHEYEVEAVVADAGILKHSEGNATASATTRPIGIWLADETDSTGILIAGKEKASMLLGEVSEVYDPIGATSPVIVLETRQGYRGSFNGILLEPEDRDNFIALWKRYTVLRLIIGDLNIPVRIYNVSAIPSPIGDEAGYDISFAFFQTGEEDRIGVTDAGPTISLPPVVDEEIVDVIIL